MAFSLVQCPRCGCVDLHSSRNRGVFEAAMRAIGIGPRRCSACGWRGLRPRFLFPPSRHTSNAHAAGDQAQAKPAATAAAPTDTKPAAPAESKPHEAAQHSHRRKHRRHLKARNRKLAAAKVLAIGVALGVAVGFAVGACGR